MFTVRYTVTENVAVFTYHLAVKLIAFVSSQWFSLYFLQDSQSLHILQQMKMILSWKWKCLSEIYSSSVSKSSSCLFFMINLQFSDCFLILTAFSFLLFFSRFTQFFLSERAFVKFIQLMFDMAPHVTQTHCFYL